MSYSNETWRGGPSDHQRTSSLKLSETEALISSYEHLSSQSNSAEALLILRKIGSLVKPIMRKRGWRVGVLSEFLPTDKNLLGLNCNRGQRICLRLRYPNDPTLFMPFEDCVDTMLHELSHIIHGPHDAKFNALWDELRDEHETLMIKGFTGQGFLSKGIRLGGGRIPPPSELHRLARRNVEEARKRDDGQVLGNRLGGKRLMVGQDPRETIVAAIERRNTINKGCASGTKEANELAKQSQDQGIQTIPINYEDDDRAIAEALLELWEEEERLKLEPLPKNVTTTSHVKQDLFNIQNEEDQLRWAMKESIKESSPLQDQTAKESLKRPRPEDSPTDDMIQPNRSIPPSNKWTCTICTLENLSNHLACSACNTERSPTNLQEFSESENQSISKSRLSILDKKNAAANLAKIRDQSSGLKRPSSIGWICKKCGTFMEHKYWTCSNCEQLKEDSSVSEHYLN